MIVVMKSIAIATVLFAGGVWAADEGADRAAIENTIRVFSMMPGRPGLVTSDFDPEELARLEKAASAGDGAITVTVDGAPGTVVISKEPMGEAVWLPAGMHAPLTVKKIRFVTEDVAMVDAVGKAPVLIVMKKVGMDWKIASLRVLAEK
jgi:hypothetical protein